MEGRGQTLDVEGFVAALSPFRGTTFSLGSVSQVCIGNVCEFILIQSTTPARCLLENEHDRCQKQPRTAEDA